MYVRGPHDDGRPSDTRVVKIHMPPHAEEKWGACLGLQGAGSCSHGDRKLMLLQEGLLGPLTGPQGFPVGRTPSCETGLLCGRFSFWRRPSVYPAFRQRAGRSGAFPEPLFLKNNLSKIIIYWRGQLRSPQPSFTSQMLLLPSSSCGSKWALSCYL